MLRGNQLKGNIAGIYTSHDPALRQFCTRGEIERETPEASGFDEKLIDRIFTKVFIRREDHGAAITAQIQIKVHRWEKADIEIFIG